MKININDYKFKYETHMHTNQSSACGENTGAEMAKAYKKAGYSGIIITDHHFGGNTRPDRDLPWEQWVDEFCSGYEEAKRTGDQIGLDVFFGWEGGFHATEFLIYGLDKQWMKQHPELRSITIEEQYRLVHQAGGMVIHAHPFRERGYIKQIRLLPKFVDGVEAINAVHSNSLRENDSRFNDSAFEYAALHKLSVTAGSDAHSVNAFLGGGMLFKRKLNSIQDFINAIKNNEDYILTDGETYYDKNNNKITEM